MNEYIYILVSEDKFEFPIMISDNSSEIADYVGTKRNTVVSAAIKAEKGIVKRSKYRRVKAND